MFGWVADGTASIAIATPLLDTNVFNDTEVIFLSTYFVK
jgi:hypothetical protein